MGTKTLVICAMCTFYFQFKAHAHGNLLALKDRDSDVEEKGGGIMGAICSFSDKFTEASQDSVLCVVVCWFLEVMMSRPALNYSP